MSEPEKPESKPSAAAQAGAAHGKAVADAVGGAATAVVDGTKAAGKAVSGAVSGDASDKETPKADEESATGIGGFFEGIWGKIKKFVGSFSEDGGIGKVLGGLLGLAGAWFAGNFFGGGILSTILMVALALPLMLAGSDTIGGAINGWLGKGKTPAAGGQVAQSPAAAPSLAVVPAAAPDKLSQQIDALPTPVGVAKALTNEELLAIASPINQRVYLSVDAANKIQVSPIADSAPMGAGVHSLATLRQMVLDKGGAPMTGIAFTPMSNGGISVAAANIANLSTPQGRG